MSHGFGIIACSATFLHTCSWINWSMRMLDDEDVGLKEKPQDTGYIKRLHPNETQSTGSVGKLIIMESIINFIPLLGTADLGMGRFVTP